MSERSKFFTSLSIIYSMFSTLTYVVFFLMFRTGHNEKWQITNKHIFISHEI